MTIYDTSGEVILDAPVTTDAVIRYVLMGDYYIGLPFNLLEPADFPRGSYVMYKGRKFEIMSNVRPEFDDTTGGYKYSLQFWAQQNHMKRRKCKWLQGQNPETTFHDTTDLASFGNLIADNMNAFLGGENWKVAAVPKEFAKVTKLVSFDRDSCWDAINTIAETFDVEWWTVENGAEVWIYFGKLEFGTPEVFKRGDVVTSIPAKKGDDANYGTRFFVFGSTRNLTADYGQAPQGGTTNHVSEVRLRLPNGQEYIDARENLKPADVVEQVAYFEDIYPKNTDTVTSVDRSQDRQTSNGTKYKARIIYAKDAPFVPTDLIEGETLQAVITSGPLSGRTFDIQLGSEFQDPDAWDPEQNPFDRKFEIVADIEDAGDGEELIIPNDSLDIDAGDTFVLTGVKLPDERIKEAEQELLKAGKAWAIKNSSDTDVYDCPTNPVYCQRHDKNYDPGQKVLLQDPRFGASGRQSRIQGFEKKLYNEYIATYTVGDNTSYSRLAAIEKDIEESAYAERIGVVNGVGIYLIRSKYDTTLPTDYNAYSALAAETLFLNKRKGGTVLGGTTFDKDITIGGSVVSKDFRQGDFSGSGFGAYRDKNGNAVLEADILKIRKEAIFNEAVINQVTFRVGATVFSNGGCEITRVEELETAFRCYYDNKEGRRYSGLTTGDQVRCQQYDPTQHTIIKYYWRLVTAVGEDYVELSKSDADGSASPEAGDEIAQFGNRSDITRQSAIVINPLDGGSVEVYAHIDAYSLSEKNYVGMGVNPQTGEAYMYAYGDMFFGDRDLADSKSSWITYQKKEGEERRRLRIKADVTFGADSSGLGNLSEFKAQQQQIDDARKEAEEAKKEVGNIQFSAVNLIDGSKSITVTAPDGANYTHKSFPINGGVRAGEQLALSVGNIGVLAGTPAGFNVVITNEDKNTWLTNSAELTADNRNAVFSVHADIVAQKALLLIYAGPTGATSGNIVRFDQIMLVRGNKPALSWSPSIADQEKYTDDKVGGIQIGSVNLLDGSREFTVTAGSGNNYKFQVFDIGEVEAGEVFALSVENISVLAGTPGELSVRMYNEGASKDLANYVEISAEERTALFTIKSDVTKQKAKVLFYAGKYAATAGNSVRYEGAVLVRGNKPALSWSPSIADQEKYADETADQAVNGVETLIDASKLDQNTYYPVTIELNSIARSKITVRVNLSDTQPGNPAWATYSNRPGCFSCQAVWSNNGNQWGSNHDKRIIEEYQYRWTETPPIGSVGQMGYSSNEYIYVRGGGVYRFFATNAGTPVLHTEAYTVNEQTIDLKTSVEPLVSLQEQANSTQQEAETTRKAIADMNDDTIFDVSEKQSIRTQWENISGYARTDVSLDSLSATNGSYYRVRDMAIAAGISTAGLLAAVNSLRVKLNDYALYTASNTPGFDRAGLAVLFTAYYAQEIDVLNAVSQKYTDGKVADIETSMKDYDYLKLVFPNNTVDNNGVFLSQLMAVKNGTSASAAVVAGLYGGGVDSLNNAGFKDTTHGILMMFAGATSIQNVAAAKTRIYGDGTLYTSKLVAQAGTIAGFTIGTGYIGSENLTGSEYFYLSSSVIKNGKKDTYAMIGDTMYREKWKVAATLYNHYGSTGIGLVVDMGDNSHAAIYVPNGTFSGFRPMSRSYDNGTYTLKGNEEETVFFVNTSKGSTTFYLPSNPQPDQRYEIRKLHSGNSIIINAQNNGDIYVTGSNNPSSQISWTGRRCVTIQYSKNLDAWVMWFSYEA
nr:MAG TPA: tail protein [Caudoviricetes sp.]